LLGPPVGHVLPFRLSKLKPRPALLYKEADRGQRGLTVDQNASGTKMQWQLGSCAGHEKMVPRLRAVIKAGPASGIPAR
jgi:hypothetical protein